MVEDDEKRFLVTVIKVRPRTRVFFSSLNDISLLGIARSMRAKAWQG